MKIIFSRHHVQALVRILACHCAIFASRHVLSPRWTASLPMAHHCQLCMFEQSRTASVLSIDVSRFTSRVYLLDLAVITKEHWIKFVTALDADKLKLEVGFLACSDNLITHLENPDLVPDRLFRACSHWSQYLLDPTYFQFYPPQSCLCPSSSTFVLLGNVLLS